MDKQNLNFYILEKNKKLAKICYDLNKDKTDVKLYLKKDESPIVIPDCWDDIEKFLKSRLFPIRKDLEDTLKVVGLSKYDDIEILKETKGKMLKDFITIKFF